MQSLPVNYLNHETVYRRLKTQADWTGWGGQAELARSLSLLDQMLAWPGVPQRGRSLELGCGAGNVSLHLAKRGWDAHGVDISPTAIAWANENARLQGFEVTRCIVQNGFATRYIAAAGELVDEVVSAGFVVAQHTLVPATADGELDELLLQAKRP
jgi:SAM-dependent methyltransferase